MFKVLILTFLGLLISLCGVSIAFIGLKGLEDSSSYLPWLMLASAPLIGFGTLFLLRAGRSDATVVKKMKQVPSQPKEGEPGFEKQLEKNNAMDAMFGKTNDARNRLKMLELSADANKGS